MVVESAFLGRPDFQSGGPQNPYFEGFRSDLGQTSGAPQTQMDPTPQFWPSDFFLLGEGGGESEAPGKGGEGGVGSLLKIAGGGGLQEGEGPRGQVHQEGVCGELGNFGGGGGNFFFVGAETSTKQRDREREREREAGRQTGMLEISKARTQVCIEEDQKGYAQKECCRDQNYSGSGKYFQNYFLKTD